MTDTTARPAVAEPDAWRTWGDAEYGAWADEVRRLAAEQDAHRDAIVATQRAPIAGSGCSVCGAM